MEVQFTAEKQVLKEHSNYHLLLQRGDPHQQQLSPSPAPPSSSPLRAGWQMPAPSPQWHQLSAVTFAALYAPPDNFSHFISCLLSPVRGF